MWVVNEEQLYYNSQGFSSYLQVRGCKELVPQKAQTITPKATSYILS